MVTFQHPCRPQMLSLYKVHVDGYLSTSLKDSDAKFTLLICNLVHNLFYFSPCCSMHVEQPYSFGEISSLKDDMTNGLVIKYSWYPCVVF